MADIKEQMVWMLRRLAQAHGNKLDGLRLDSSFENIPPEVPPPARLGIICQRVGLDRPEWLKEIDPVYLPLACFTDAHGWGVVLDRRPDGQWLVVTPGGGKHILGDEALKGRCAVVDTRGVDAVFGVNAFIGDLDRHKGFIRHVYETLRLFRPQIMEACLATLFIGIIALATSLFSMQVYDRVIPTRSEYTLIILSSGVALTVLVELMMKFARSKVMDYVVVGLDNRLSREIFSRLLQVRVDQVPASVGSLAGQVRGYEQVRGFYTASTLFTLIDLPLGFLLMILMVIIASPVVAAVPFVFAILAIWIGMNMRKKIRQQALDGASWSNMKTGLLVEAVEGIETIKSGSGGWKFLARWIDVNRKTIRNDVHMRGTTESVGYIAASIQQFCYAGIVVTGSLEVMAGHMTMGTLIACSILSGRILAPIITLPNLLVQHSHAQAALEGLDRIYQLRLDNHGVERPLTPTEIKGHYVLQQVKFAYPDSPPSFATPALEIRPGERVAILGPIGAGKSTLLRLLSGMYLPSEGRVLLDGLDLSHIHRQVVAQHVGYLQQDHRLFVGTLRENLLIGLPDPGDDAVMASLRRTGMDKFVSAHPKGLDRPIAEGGKGLSGGQKQLLAFTRLILTSPEILLLDEPTATMDDEQERRCLGVLAEEANKGKTMVIVTHKPSILPLVSRILVIAGSGIVLDGPRDEVLQQLSQRGAPPPQPPQAQQVQVQALPPGVTVQASPEPPPAREAAQPTPAAPMGAPSPMVTVAPAAPVQTSGTTPSARDIPQFGPPRPAPPSGSGGSAGMPNMSVH